MASDGRHDAGADDRRASFVLVCRRSELFRDETDGARSVAGRRPGRGTGEVRLDDRQYALRTFRRAPLAALTIVVTVAIGLGVVAVLFTVLNVLLFRTDSVPDITEIYAVARPQQVDGGPSTFIRRQFSRELGYLYIIDLRSRTVVATVTGVGHEPYAVAGVER